MPKRPPDRDIEHHCVKRVCRHPRDRLSTLSDELILRTLSYLPVSELIVCERLSHRLSGLAKDSQLWKSAYYNQFVRPRASRIPGLRDREPSARSLIYSSKISKWLEDDHLVKRGRATNWKRQYKLRHNWSRGSCKVSETQVAERPSVPPLLVQLYEGIVVTVNSVDGLRAWQMKSDHKQLARTDLNFSGSLCENSLDPSSLAIDSSNSDSETIAIALGFTNGSFSIYQLSVKTRSFVHNYTHVPSSNGTVSAISYASPYLLTMTESQLLSLYRFDLTADNISGHKTFAPPILLSSLKSHTAWPPLCLTIRASSSSILASIAYSMPTYLAGWSVGLQELRLTSQGSILESRLASALEQGFAPLSTPQPPPSTGSRTPSPRRRGVDPGVLAPSTKPTSLSYNHPYLLAAHPDNTLTLYMVTSSARDLSIGIGNRLWGHTSSVSGAYVGDRGKAVSVSAQGNELRVWELEGGISPVGSRRRIAAGAASVQVRPDNRDIENQALDHNLSENTRHAMRMELSSGSSFGEAGTKKGWVAFDEEKVMVLEEKIQGSQSLVVYDFT
ncbi:hypothetical protein MMC07_006714 [Pseudocyphellaria aurata]|nr:hypothetical protein [Pseudocyphellaria aurata]